MMDVEVGSDDESEIEDDVVFDLDVEMVNFEDVGFDEGDFDSEDNLGFDDEDDEVEKEN